MKTRSLTKSKKSELLKKSNDCGLARTMGIEIIDVGYGYAKSRLIVGEKHLNVGGSLHGAVVLCLVDYTARAAGMIIDTDASVLQISANFVDINIEVEETIYCDARFIGEAEQIVYSEMIVHDKKDNLIAKATITGIKLINF